MGKQLDCVTWGSDAWNTEKFIREFINFPSKLYNSDTLTTSRKTEKQLLTGTHILSKYFTIMPYIALDNGNVVARAALTYYDNDRNAYIGFFECYEDRMDAAGLLLNTLINKARQDVKYDIIGPVDASFWIKYRMKIGYNTDTGLPLREKPYTNEPYNNTVYFNMWKRAGFEVCDKYYSNHMIIPTSMDSDPRFVEYIQKVLNRGYELVDMEEKYFDEELSNIYNLMIMLYNDFPCYKYITEQEFTELFSGLKHVINFKFAKLAYYNGKLVGFLIALPNYGNIINKDISIVDMAKINNIKHSAKEYVILYMGVQSKHLGIGAALAELMRKELEIRNAKSIEALIHTGKMSGNYFKPLVEKTSNYVLLKYTLKYARPY